jgi:hypothetical protein
MANKGGRPTKYTKALANKVYKAIAGGKSLRQIDKDERFPSKAVISEWALNDEKYPGFPEQYIRAQKIKAMNYVDEIIDISDDTEFDWIEKQRPDGSTYETVNADHITRARLKVDTRKWLASKLIPHYSDKLKIDAEVKVTSIKVTIENT